MLLESERKTSILVIDDEEGMLRSLEKLLEVNGYIVLTANSSKKGLDTVLRTHVDLVICDIVMPDTSGLFFLSELRKSIPVVMITAFASIETARKAFKLGACDYLVKPFEFNELLVVIRQNLRSAVSSNTIKSPGDVFLESSNASFQRTLRLAEKFASTDSPILITGESGVGKEIIADYIHSISRRASNPFVKINCAAIPETLLESELFGYEKGAFTGAFTPKKGLLESSTKGTFFFDEIGDMSLQLQAKILRVLQSYSFTKIGGTKEITLDCRIMAASNRELELLVAKGQFREDLLYRINGLQIHVPSLRQRKDDLPELISFFLQVFSNKYAKKVVSVEDNAVAALNAYDWPGNIRELKNSIERAVVVCEDGRINASDLPDMIIDKGQKLNDYRRPSDSYRSSYRRKIIMSALRNSNGNKADAARALKISRRTFYNWMKELEIRDE